jgi:sugar phosphate isomerase/epimerase
MQRRTFLSRTTKASLGLGLLGTTGLIGCGGPEAATGDKADVAKDTTPMAEKALWFNISLAQWSLHKALFDKEMDNLDFAKVTRETYGLEGVEYVNQFFKDKAKDADYLKQMNQRAADHGVKQLLIMIDGEGDLGHADNKERTTAIENHYKWVDAAKELGCHSIRVNARGEGTADEVAKYATDGLARLSEYAKSMNINVIVENHGGYSSNGEWLAGVIKGTGMANCGTLPDFGNFCITRDKDNWRTCLDEYDRYQGVKDLMPYAKAVSAKSYDFDDEGWVVESDYKRILQSVKDAGYKGWIGVEYEGDALSEEEGIKATIKALKMGGAMVS